MQHNGALTPAKYLTGFSTPATKSRCGNVMVFFLAFSWLVIFEVWFTDNIPCRGPNGEINDYAAKIGWAGLVKDYYLARWQSHFDFLLAALANGTEPDWNAWAAGNLHFEQAFSINMSTSYPTYPSGDDPLELVKTTLNTYAAAPDSSYTVHPGVDVRVPPAQWQLIPGSTDKVAVSSDCPWVAKGDGTSLSTCQASCSSFVTSSGIDTTSTKSQHTHRSSPNLVSGLFNVSVASGSPAAACNAVNFNAGSKDCELRLCTDPAHPTLSPDAGYSVWANIAPGSSPILTSPWHSDEGVMAFLCDSTPACRGFTSRGSLLTDVSYLVPTPGSNVFTKSPNL